MKPHPIENDRKDTESPYTRGDLSLPPGAHIPFFLIKRKADPICGDPAYWIVRQVDRARILVRERPDMRPPTDAVGREEIKQLILRALDEASLRGAQ